MKRGCREDLGIGFTGAKNLLLYGTTSQTFANSQAEIALEIQKNVHVMSTLSEQVLPPASRGIGIRQVQSRTWRVNTSRTEKRL
jgi:hypothetical protein